MKRALLGVLFVATVAGAAYLVSRIPGGVGPLLALARGIPAGHIAALAGLTVVFYCLDWVRFASLLALLDYRLRLWLGLELVCVSYFVSTLTPTADLHLPAMIYVLSRHGLEPGKAAAASVTKSIYQVTWICVVALASLAVAGIDLPPAAAASLVAAAVPLAIIVLVFLVIILFPAHAARLLRGRLSSLTGSLARLGRSTDWNHLVCHAASLAFIAVYCAIGWVLCDALGVPVSPARAIPVFSASLMVAYLAPVPGSIGVTELVTSYLIDPGLSPPALVAAGLLRVLCWYVSVLPGAVFLAVELARARRVTTSAPPA
jgi:uncharacterized membrane protein YbhN (UPF0104 family)